MAPSANRMTALHCMWTVRTEHSTCARVVERSFRGAGWGSGQPALPSGRRLGTGIGKECGRGDSMAKAVGDLQAPRWRPGTLRAMAQGAERDFGRSKSWLPASAGMTVGGILADAVQTIIPAEPVPLKVGSGNPSAVHRPYWTPKVHVEPQRETALPGDPCDPAKICRRTQLGMSCQNRRGEYLRNRNSCRPLPASPRRRVPPSIQANVSAPGHCSTRSSHVLRIRRPRRRVILRAASIAFDVHHLVSPRRLAG